MEVSYMKKVLFINACVREKSRTKILADKLIKALDGEVLEMNLEQMNLHPLTKESLRHRDALLSANEYDNPEFEVVHQFSNADVIVFAAPYWDCSFPSSVKVFIEHIMVNRITFSYTEEGFPQGNCKAKKIYYVSTAGGPVIGENLGFQYVKTVATQYWGVSDVILFQAENLDIIGANPQKIIEDASQKIRV